MLLRHYLVYISTTKLGHFLYSVYLCPCQRLGLLMQYLRDLFFFFIFIFIISNQIIILELSYHYPADIYLLKVNNRNSRTRCEICSKLTIKIPERRQWRRSGIFIVNFEHISHLVLVFLLLTLKM